VLNHAKVVDPDGRDDVSVLWGDVVCQHTFGARVCRSEMHAQVPLPERTLSLGGRSRSRMSYLGPGSKFFSLISFGTRAVPTRGGLVGAAPKVQWWRRGP
jgi:hypothetical protein